MSQQFIVSALKYRPQTFNTVIGQSHITTTLKNAIKTDQLAHSFLFCGPRGVGKTTCARILAKTINCSNRTADAEACDKCDNCNSFNNNSSYNVHELDAASNNGVDEIRGLIDQVRIAPLGESKYKVYIIDEVHMLTTQAFNAFLKTLEEPPSYAIFILATTEKHKIIPTILSRCQIFDFKRIGTKDTIEHLQEICKTEHINAEEDALHFIALKSEGCMRDALSIMDKITSFSGGEITYQSTIDNLNILDYDYYFKLTDQILLQDTSSVMVLLDEILGKGFEGDMIMNGLCEHLRNLMICKDIIMAKLMDVAESIKKRYYDQANMVSDNLIINALSILSQAELNYKQARNKRLHAELAFIKLCHLSQAIQVLSDEDGNVSKKKISSNLIIPVIRKEKNKKQEPELLINTSAIAVKEIIKPENSIVNKTEVVEEKTEPITETIIKTPKVGVGMFGNILDQAKKDLAAVKKVEKKEITQENLEANWKELIVELAGGNQFFAKALQNSTIVYTENQITISVAGSMGFGVLNDNKLKIGKSFQTTYSFEGLQLSVLLDTSNVVEEAPLKSRREILEELSIKYPLLAKMRDTLGLEYEY
jgi:DNA polymerase III subunit gamma/tau